MPTPEDLRFSYQEFPTPIVIDAHSKYDSRQYTFVKRGAMRASLDMPEGEFFLMWATDDDRTQDYEEEEVLRAHVFADLMDAYERMKARAV